jgi:hypothetical protein
MPVRTLGNEVPHVRHQHVAAEPRFFPGTTSPLARCLQLNLGKGRSMTVSDLILAGVIACGVVYAGWWLMKDTKD